MDARQMQYEFELRITQLGEPMSKRFLSSDIEDYLNKAQEMFFLNEYNDFDREESTRKELSSLVQTYETVLFASDATGLPNGFFVSLPTELLYVANEWVTYNSVFTKVKPITHDYYTANKDNPYKKPYSDLVWRLDVNGMHELITDGTSSLSSYNMRYIKRLPDIVISTNTSCALNAITHSRIVDIAVAEAINDYQSKFLSNQKTTE